VDARARGHLSAVVHPLLVAAHLPLVDAVLHRPDVALAPARLVDAAPRESNARDLAAIRVPTLLDATTTTTLAATHPALRSTVGIRECQTYLYPPPLATQEGSHLLQESLRSRASL
jgi:hypothetical protein